MIVPDFYVDEHEMTLEDIEESDMTVEEVKVLLQKFERKYGMTSQDFSKKWKKGETDWVADSVAWITLFESYQALNGQAV